MELQMKAKNLQNQAGLPVEALRSMSRSQSEAGFSVLCTSLDAQLMFGEAGLSIDVLQPLFEVYWPKTSLIQTIRELLSLGLLNTTPGPIYSVPSERSGKLAAELGDHLVHHSFHFPGGTSEFWGLLDGFSSYSSRELKVDLGANNSVTETWGGRAYTSEGQLHHLLLRPSPLQLRSHTTAFILMLCALPDTAIKTIADHFARSRALRQRVALYDLDRSQKINLTRSDVFVFFERYLRRVHGLRISPAPALTQSLVDGGLLSLEKG